MANYNESSIVALATGSIEPSTGMEKHFLRVIKGLSPPMTQEEKEWLKIYKKNQLDNNQQSPQIEAEKQSAGSRVILNSRDLIERLQEIGFSRYKPKSNSYKDVMIADNIHNQSLYILVGAGWIDLKFYSQKKVLVLDGQGKIHIEGGLYKRQKIESRNGLHTHIFSLAEKFNLTDFNGHPYFKDVKVERDSSSIEIDLVVFDLDDTLLKTADLSNFRGYDNVGPRPESYVKDLRCKFSSAEGRYIYSLMDLQNFRKKYPKVYLGVFTTSPRVYATTLLEAAYPGLQWDAIVAFEDVPRTKPHPDGIYLAMRLCAVTDIKKVVLIGDSIKDIESSYSAGCWSVVETSSWSEKRSNEHYKVLAMMPDARAAGISRIRAFPEYGHKMLPALEGAYQSIKKKPHLPLRYARYVCTPPESHGLNEGFYVYALGRYFAKSVPRRASWSNLNNEVISIKNIERFPCYWVDCAANFVSYIKNYLEEDLVVTVMPAKPGRPRRMEGFLNQISGYFSWPRSISFIPNVLGFNGDATSQHMNRFSREERYENIRKSLRVCDSNGIVGKNVLVIDDVTTSGASFYFAKKYIESYGAKNVLCLAMVKTISMQ